MPGDPPHHSPPSLPNWDPLHLDRLDRIEAGQLRLTEQVAQLAHAFNHFLIAYQTQGAIVMTVLDDIKAKQAQILTELTADDDLISSLTTALETKDTQLADLKTALDAANAQIAASGVDTTALTDISDTMGQLLSEADKQNAALVAATRANTPVDPNAPPADSGTPTPPAPPVPATGPVVASISPTSGAAGTQITITGSGLTGAEAVSIGGVSIPTTDMAVNSDTEMTGVVPAAVVGAPGNPVSVVVTTAAGSSDGSQTFTYA